MVTTPFSPPPPSNPRKGNSRTYRDALKGYEDAAGRIYATAYDDAIKTVKGDAVFSTALKAGRMAVRDFVRFLDGEVE